MISLGSDTSYRKQSVVNRRMFILSVAKVLVFSGIIARLFFCIKYYSISIR